MGKVRDGEFGRRLLAACEAHPSAPVKHEGRLRWVQERLKSRGVEVSAETCRKWIAGEARPRPDKLHHLAKALNISEATLLGLENQPTGEIGTSLGNASARVEEVPIPLRHDVTVYVRGLPSNLSKTEAQKVGAVVMAFAL